MLKLEIPNDIFEQMLKQARAEAPIEACGILAGRGERVHRMYRMTNIEGREDHYMMAPKEQFAAVKDMRSAELELLAIYHSHPATAARPSAEDVRLAFTPDIAYVIISLGEDAAPVTRAFVVEDRQPR
ncbi:MAG: M67 family metallopeptidase, partial [Planctomycetota bacterium]